MLDPIFKSMWLISTYMGHDVVSIFVVTYDEQLLHHKIHRSWFGNNNCAKSTFHRFVWNRHKCHSSICIVWISMSCTLFKHKCYMFIHIIQTYMLCVYSCCLQVVPKFTTKTHIFTIRAQHLWNGMLSLNNSNL
jgi:hypothetical protein